MLASFRMKGVPFPPGFDYAFVTVEVENMLIRFCRGREEIGSTHHLRDLHELGLVLSLLDEDGDYKQNGFSSLYQAGRALESHMDILKRALGQGLDEKLARRLREVTAHDRIATREAEWEINKHLRSDRE